MKMAKTSEATTNINNIFKAASGFYAREHTGKGMSGSTSAYCVVESTDLQPPLPIHQKRRFIPVAGFKTLGFSIADLVYYGYGITSPTSDTMQCQIPPNTDDIYTFSAIGDIDGDGIFATFSLAVGSDDHNQLYHGRGIFAENPVE
jgi:hypothetical protein